ncbi:hypothetical protein BU24DRAFT_194595 [Aaosphaeria arxii CBS 175.79]|uniref:Uncharacterized protein n=1 Tax=Aaosphaeria arxii CBS 175.79 TaxID=1450172 RepID=A0A6A5XT96_9PLEO|nr:uncharacterized protein BU24DRAFT_194595 [Aaosphaeria arxii CBS 175.79]KAF2016139.1 hypothetical protein BU24DRAFT_194595 [Aaosphaeria arxii CBS 175.79]
MHCPIVALGPSARQTMGLVRLLLGVMYTECAMYSVCVMVIKYLKEMEPVRHARGRRLGFYSIRNGYGSVIDLIVHGQTIMVERPSNPSDPARCVAARAHTGQCIMVIGLIGGVHCVVRFLFYYCSGRTGYDSRSWSWRGESSEERYCIDCRDREGDPSVWLGSTLGGGGPTAMPRKAALLEEEEEEDKEREDRRGTTG